MQIALLSRSPRSYSTRRLRDAARGRGHTVRMLDVLKCALTIEGDGPRVWHGKHQVGQFDAVLPRIGASVTMYGCAVVRQFEQMGVFCLNSANSIVVARDKLRSMQILSRHPRIAMPQTAFVRDRNDVIPAIQRVGGAPVIIKLLEGTQGIGVILADTDKVAEAIVETLHTARQSVLIQRFVSESKGRDVRAFVVGGRVVAAMRRTAQASTEFRSNVHRGGSVEGMTLPPEYERTAVMAAQVMGLHVAGVDMLEGKNGPLVMEVNSSPGLEGIERATGIDVAGEVVAHLEQQVMFPEIDLRQRLSLRSGYGVAELRIGRDSPFVGATVSGTGLRKQDVLVLSIQRGELAIPNPRESREILAGDVLLCFGLLTTLRSLLPAPKRRRRKAGPASPPVTPPAAPPVAPPSVTS